MGEKPYNIQERTFAFAVEIVNLTRRLPSDTAARVIANQLVKSGTSIGANAEEASAGQSRTDFLHKMRIALKEAHETHYWLRLLAATDNTRTAELEPLIDEADQIMRIIGAIISRGKSNRE